METLLESLAVLGKLGNALDNISQRLPGEIFSLVETTLGEVEERAEFGRRQSMLLTNSGIRASDGVYAFNNGISVSGIPTLGVKGPHLKASGLRLSALESLAKRADHEILLDLFWTLYSKLDAVAQGFRVVTEIANRIGSVRRSYRKKMSRLSYSNLLRDEITRTPLEPNLECCFHCKKYGIMFSLR